MKRVAKVVCWMILGAAVLLGVDYSMRPIVLDGDKELLAAAMKLSGRNCGTPEDETNAQFGGERGEFCDPPAIINRDLNAVQAYGLYDHTVSPRVVYVDLNAAPVGTPIYRETVMHEYVHYLQWANGDLPPKLDICTSAKLEIEAHTADAKFTNTEKAYEDAERIINGYQMKCLISKFMERFK